MATQNEGGLSRAAFAWVLQLTASLCWVVSVFVYDSWGTGDVLQFCAAASWVISNFLSEDFKDIYTSIIGIGDTNKTEKDIQLQNVHKNVNKV